MEFSITELANDCGCSPSTFKRRLAKLKEEKKFTKTSMGRFFNEVDAVSLSRLIGFTIKSLKNQ